MIVYVCIGAGVLADALLGFGLGWWACGVHEARRRGGDVDLVGRR